MLEIFARCNSWLSQHMFFVVLSALLFGFTSPLPQAPLLNTIAVVLFAYMTFVTALETNYKSFFHVLTRPWVTLWMLLLIHGVMPLVAWLIGLLFYPQSELTRLGFLIGASVPIGVTSVIWTSITRGDVSQALVAVTADTLISPLLLPVFILLVAGQTVHVYYGQMMMELLLMVTIPSFLGMAVNAWTHGSLAGFTRSAGGFTSKLALFGVILINASAIAPEINWNSSLLKMLLTILFISVSGYYLGYAGSYALKERRRDTVATMVYNVGMRNISFGSVLAVTYFPPAVAIPVTLAMLYQQPLAAVVSYLFHRFDRLSMTKGRTKGRG
ncbi:Sodium Bile acid symporter family protein [Pelotomaculum schinkii]|uniref:Sodium Bile acid symporter family protein n=1 Tax=Pelotomaculum schinkii TaxID=78350 RepID=A0A4Y7RB86_9FIRM|nr:MULTISPECIES: bile acid:sodium symporter family protein [Pelotomaculum]TEB06009.1 Sodium Bile acid symporter family protein [Pelotomaculum schinkii]TEB13943.1 Sodium Bile acid symporter family protein [Pelotomaculum sp. FP]